MEALCNSVGDEAAEILKTCRDSFVVDWQNFFSAEHRFYLGRQFEPLAENQADEAYYSGTIDAIYLMPGEQVARVEDYKSHPRPFDPTTFQAKLYSLAIFMHLPTLNEIEFVLRFVRYPNVSKPIKFFRSDVPQLMEDVRRVRARQLDYHDKEAAGEEFQALAGTHCVYCPAITDFSCPIAKLNPMTNLSPAERLNYRLWHDAANRANNTAMQQWVDGTGQSIHGQDANGKHYTFGPESKETVTFPLFEQDDEGFKMPIVDALLDWATVSPEDVQPTKRSPEPWLTKLRIGSSQLKPYLKAKKREIIDNAIKDLARKETKIVLKVTRDAEIDDGTGEEYRTWDASGDEEIAF
jgi:hypothetical protein